MYSEWHDDQNDTAHIASRTDSLISAINSHFGKKEQSMLRHVNDDIKTIPKSGSCNDMAHK